ncbi:hypothetical protein DSM106972_026690 [Dulcicalothrix desertica PCC 7102]|uniref:HTH araC/xylS-type domain-containing protein n=1 Tax=Dulcicalothrix desertica PCC 7102 TaxID=232991 RepID=A0A3S1CFK0_9CYAN|nr:hypothetical protein [Dulcicalothrix desertica]RUT06412.1 hypothetical protein DSM106972_026690 [Dulcicalothrix desertica PCC 7102]
MLKTKSVTGSLFRTSELSQGLNKPLMISGGIIKRLYIESLTQVLIIHMLRHYSSVTQTITSEKKSLTRTQLQQTIDYIHTYLDRDLSLGEIAGVLNISPTPNS